ncbi:hypothetical protein DFJ74DRAFT_775680 [Hyaloraphidium curvatum]|nr:hypothetical protein DFJ74DRAFT_775680 [Hyaloraphidium curvatum]
MHDAPRPLPASDAARVWLGGEPAGVPGFFAEYTVGELRAAGDAAEAALARVKFAHGVLGLPDNDAPKRLARNQQARAAQAALAAVGNPAAPAAADAFFEELKALHAVRWRLLGEPLAWKSSDEVADLGTRDSGAGTVLPRGPQGGPLPAGAVELVGPDGSAFAVVPPKGAELRLRQVAEDVVVLEAVWPGGFARWLGGWTVVGGAADRAQLRGKGRRGGEAMDGRGLPPVGVVA